MDAGHSMTGKLSSPTRKKSPTSGLHPSAAPFCCASSLVLGTKEFVNVLMFKLLDQLPQAIKDSSQRVRLIIADFLNQGVEVVHKPMVVSKSLRGGQSELVEDSASFSWAHLSTPLIICTMRQNVADARNDTHST
jgi:hypothetical protein